MVRHLSSHQWGFLCFLLLLLFGSSTSSAVSTPLVDPLIVHKQRETIPSSFSFQGAAESTESLTLHIVLAQSNPQGLEAALYAVSDPQSDRYGKHLTKQEVAEFVKPKDGVTDAVLNWLRNNELDPKSTSFSGDRIDITLTVSQANTLLNADFGHYKHESSNATLLRTMSYSVPSTLAPSIKIIHPTTDMSAPLVSPLEIIPNAKAQVAPNSCAQNFNLSCVQEIYNIPGKLNSVPSPENIVGIASFGSNAPQIADISSFLHTFRPDFNISDSTLFDVITLDGGSDPQSPSEAGPEGNADIEYVLGLTPQTKIRFYADGDQTLDSLLDALNLILEEDPLPTVYSFSFAAPESKQESELEQQVCNAFMQLGARGTSIITGSGDSGVGVSPCVDFDVTFPSNCPFATAVGGTTGVNPETAGFFSTGGFSNTFTMPTYQQTAVQNYLSQIGSLNQGLFNRSGRAIPDIAAIGDFIPIVSGGTTFLTRGTSLSTPIFASIIALINQERLASGQSVLGFLNPVLYTASVSKTFTDITQGSNPGCGTNGFPALSGWDAVTGLGTPNFPALLAALRS